MVRLLMCEVHEEECSQDRAKAQMELKLSRKVRIRRFCVYIGGRKGKDSMKPLLSGFRVLVASYREKDVIHSSQIAHVKLVLRSPILSLLLQSGSTHRRKSWGSSHPSEAHRYITVHNGASEAAKGAG